MLEWRLNAFKVFNKLPKPQWAKLNIPEIDYKIVIITQYLKV